MSKWLIWGLILVLMSAGLVRVFRQIAIKNRWMDVPNERSSHVIPTPKGGGIVFMGLWVLTQIFLYHLNYITIYHLLLFLPGMLLVAGVGFLDDVQILSSKKRFLVQGLAATLCVGMSVVMNPAAGAMLWLVPVAIVGLVWSTNLFNFMDGLDGFAGVEAVFVLGMGSVVCWCYKQPALACVAGSMALLVFGFLTANWPKASIFMSSAGSYPLGFLIGALAGAGLLIGGIPIVLWIILYGVFWFDATVTLLRRMYYKEPWTSPHRSHAYQRLHQAGFSHKQVLWRFIGLNGILGVIVAILLLKPTWMWAGLAVAMALLSYVYKMVEQLKPMQKNSR